MKQKSFLSARLLKCVVIVQKENMDRVQEYAQIVTQESIQMH
jgi:hypothetical protein